MIKIFILLYGFSNFNLDKFYILFFFCTESVIYVPPDIIQNKHNRLEKCVGVNKYDNSIRGVYRHSTYIVQPGDTLFYIAWIAGQKYMDLAYSNNIKNVNLIQVGQVLKIRANVGFLCSGKLFKIIFNSVNHCHYVLKKLFFYIKKNSFCMKVYKTIVFDSDLLYKEDLRLKKLEMVVHHDWHWPTYGKVIDTFSDAEGGNKGIDISGTFGQPILAVNTGKVVYIGNTLRGYGNLIVIRHANDYLSAYAHNDMILVTEQQRVKIGDKIATMGNSGTNEIKLHFEIRYKERSVDPMYYLSKRH